MEHQNNAHIYQHNKQIWDRMVTETHRFTKPARDEDFENPLQAIDTHGWFGSSIVGREVLCLAAGGGRQGPLFAAAGGNVTVVDISPKMLELDLKVAQERRLVIKTCCTSMDDLAQLGRARFDIVAQPVSTCYVPNIRRVFEQVAQVTKPGGLYVSQHKQPVSLQSSTKPIQGRYQLEETYYRNQPLPQVGSTPFREDGAVEYLHRWEDMVGGICRSGFLIEDLIEPFHANDQSEDGEFGHRCCYIAPYVRIKARRQENLSSTIETPGIWTPDH